MKCNDVRELLSEYLDQELAEQQASEVRQHLAGCKACSLELEELGSTLRVVHSLPRQEPVFELWQEFAPRCSEMQAEMRLGPIRRHISRISIAIVEGWRIFLSVVRLNMHGETNVM